MSEAHARVSHLSAVRNVITLNNNKTKEKYFLAPHFSSKLNLSASSNISSSRNRSC